MNKTILLHGQFNKFFFFILNFFFPLQCCNCRNYLPYYPVKHLCDKCENELYADICVVCQVCSKRAGLNNEAPYLCGDCRFKKDPPLKIISVAKYEGILKNLIHQLKYNLRENISITLARVMLDFLKLQKIQMNKYDAVIPMPISKVKKRERGFNQIEFICRKICGYYNIELNKKILKRKYHKKPQVALSRRERLINPQNSFELKKNSNIKGKSFILVDDVKSTGSTLYFASKILFDAGVSEVLCITLADNA
ncbi:ComF family protein [bacterium]|nr:ComF family protein [bacterium]